MVAYPDVLDLPHGLVEQGTMLIVTREGDRRCKLPPHQRALQFGSWCSNFMTAYHARYGGNGVMIYWHVEKKNVCIYSQLKSCSSSEFAAMIEGLLRHCTDAEIESNYVDTHGASVVGFAFTELLNFRLLPRLKSIGSIRLYRPDDAPPETKSTPRRRCSPCTCTCTGPRSCTSTRFCSSRPRPKRSGRRSSLTRTGAA